MFQAYLIGSPVSIALHARTRIKLDILYKSVLGADPPRDGMQTVRIAVAMTYPVVLASSAALRQARIGPVLAT